MLPDMKANHNRRRVSIRRLANGDENVASRVVTLFKEVPCPEQHITRFLANSSNYFYVAEIKNKPVGFLLAYRLDRCDGEKSMMHLYEIGVLEEFQRQGVGKALVNEIRMRCEREQVRKLFVITNESNLPAMKLFKSTNGKRETTDEALFVFKN